jgi:hypothetical protein
MPLYVQDGEDHVVIEILSVKAKISGTSQLEIM